MARRDTDGTLRYARGVRFGLSEEYEIERLYRDAPLLLIGEGTPEIKRMVIGRKLLRRYNV